MIFILQAKRESFKKIKPGEAYGFENAQILKAFQRQLKPESVKHVSPFGFAPVLFRKATLLYAGPDTAHDLV
ncbi:MAG: hypothetical protein O9353_14135, partial [Bacteroidia bacterium]|nr:hypothetical protein [Bacteroidia bacterium]